MAAVLEAGHGAALSHETAAERLGIWHRGHGPIHVTSPRQHRPVADQRVVFHRSTSLVDRDVIVVDDIPTTGLPRTCLDMGRTHRPHQLAHVLYEAAFSGLLDLDSLDAYLAAHARHGGVACAREAVNLYLGGCAGTRTRSEDRFLELIRRAGLPDPVVNTPGATGLLGEELDFVWLGARLVVELDGPCVHGRPGVSTRDAARDDVLVRGGWLVWRIDPADVWSKPRVLMRTLARLLAERA